MLTSFETFSSQAVEAHGKLLTKVKNKNKKIWDNSNEHKRHLLMLNEYYLELKFGEIINKDIAPTIITSEALNFSASILERWFILFDCLYLCRDQLFDYMLTSYNGKLRDKYFENIFGFGFEVTNFVHPPERQQAENHTKIAKQRRKNNQMAVGNDFGIFKVEDMRIGAYKDVQPIFFEEVYKIVKNDSILINPVLTATTTNT